jgi:poly(A) polymerase
MTDAGLLLRVLGGVSYLAAFENMTKVENSVGAKADPVQRLGALGVGVVEDAERLSLHLRLTNAESARLTSMADRWWQISPAGGEQDARVLLYRLGPERYADRVLLAWARSADGAANTEWRALASLPQRWSAPVFPLKAADFMKRGVDKGPALGAALRLAENTWVAADFPAAAAALDTIADEAVRNARTSP